MTSRGGRILPIPASLCRFVRAIPVLFLVGLVTGCARSDAPPVPVLLMLDSLGALDDGFEYDGVPYLGKDLVIATGVSFQERMERHWILRRGEDGQWRVTDQFDRFPQVSVHSPLPPSAPPSPPEAAPEAAPPTPPAFPLPETMSYDSTSALVTLHRPPSGSGRWGDLPTVLEFSYPSRLWGPRSPAPELEEDECLVSRVSPGGDGLLARGSFSDSGSGDWAVGCWNDGISYIRVVWNGSAACSPTLGAHPDTAFLTARPSGVAGFGRVLDAVAPNEIESFLRRYQTDPPFPIKHWGIMHHTEGEAPLAVSYCRGGEWVELVPRRSTLEEASVREGACPFECCGYGTWWAGSTVPVHAEPRPDAPVVHALQRGDTVHAETGQVQLVPTPLVWTAEHTTAEGGTYSPGDTLYLLESLGESRYHVWRDSLIFMEELSFLDSYPKPPVPPAHLVGERQTRWWARIRTADGIEGWVEGHLMEGSDGCGE